MLAQTAASASPSGPWSFGYELKAVSLLALGLGLVGLDRFIINPLFPVMQKDLGLNYQHLGLISAVLALAWGVASILSGRLSDRIGTKRTLVPAMVVFSLLAGGSGLAAGLVSLLLIRTAMGLAEGAYVPASIVATIDASKPSRIGLNVGLQQMAQPAFGLALGPVLAVALLKVVPSWHWVFVIVALPGLLLAALLWRVLRDMPRVELPQAKSAAPTKWTDVLKHRAVVVNALSMVCFLTCLITLSAFMPNYLTDHLKLDLDAMGMVLAGQGVGSLVGMVLLPALSDRIGRRPAIIVALVIELAILAALPSIGAQPAMLFGALFVATFMNAGAVAITVGPLTHAAVPAALATTATGVVVGLGEIFGGALAPAVAGALAQQHGITVIPTIGLAATAAGLVVAVVGVREPLKPSRETATPAGH
jgi:MFS family permease